MGNMPERYPSVQTADTFIVGAFLNNHLRAGNRHAKNANYPDVFANSTKSNKLAPVTFSLVTIWLF